MVIWLHRVPDLAHNAILIDQEGLAVDAHKRSTGVTPLFPDAIELGNRRIGIGKQRKGQAILVRKFLMGRHIIRADAQHDDTLSLHLVIGITESAGFFRTARSIILWIEI